MSTTTTILPFLTLTLLLLLPHTSSAPAPTCADPGASPSGRTACPAGASASLTIINLSRISVSLHFRNTHGTARKIRDAPPGYRFVRSASCLGHRWEVRTQCGQCVAVVEVRDRDTVFAFHDADADAQEACPPPRGRWGAPYTWPRGLVPAALVNLPGGKVLGFSAKLADGYMGPGPEGNDYTFAGVWDPATRKVTAVDLMGHNGFCPGMTLLANGDLVVTGGGQNRDGYRVSTFDTAALRWKRHRDMNHAHWYGTAVDLGAARGVMVALGVIQAGMSKVDSYFPEISEGYDFGGKWGELGNVDLDGHGPNVMNWYPHMHLMEDGKVLMSGTQNRMYVIDPRGQGNITYVGKRNTEDEDREAWGAYTLYYDKNRLLAAGGIDGWTARGDPAKYFNRKHVISVNMNPKQIRTTHVAKLTHERSFLNLVNLPTGDVLAVGGNRIKRQFSDKESEFRPEWWNPVTNKWTVGKPMSVPRNYHSTAVLLKDGTVMSAGGGLCGDCDVNHPDHQIFYPAYLFDQDGKPARRPGIVDYERKWRLGTKTKITVAGALAGRIIRFSIIHHSSVTHTLSPDSRMLKVARDLTVAKKKLKGQKFQYVLQLEKNPNVMTRGRWLLFVVNSRGVPSEGQDILVV